MAVLPHSGLNTTAGVTSPQTLFYGLFFGLGGGILLLFLFIVLTYWRYVRSGRIRLGAGGPGDLDDEQRLLEEEHAAMDELDVSQQEAYFRAKGMVLM
jgi:hypothetical protein